MPGLNSSAHVEPKSVRCPPLLCGWKNRGFSLSSLRSGLAKVPAAVSANFRQNGADQITPCFTATQSSTQATGGTTFPSTLSTVAIHIASGKCAAGAVFQPQSKQQVYPAPRQVPARIAASASCNVLTTWAHAQVWQIQSGRAPRDNITPRSLQS